MIPAPEATDYLYDFVVRGGRVAVDSPGGWTNETIL